MACRYTYKGKTYEAHEFDDVLRAMSPAEASAFMPSVQPIPRAPFVEKTEAWVALALKRIIRMAAEEGFDRVAIIRGEQAAKMFNLSEHVTRLYYDRDGRGYILSADGRRGEVFPRDMQYSDEELDGVVGKEIAQKIRNREGREDDENGGMILEGVDLKVGGEGMEKFYPRSDLGPVGTDKNGKPIYPIVQLVAQKVLKQLRGPALTTVRVDRTTFGNRGRPADWSPRDGTFSEQPGFDITPEMRDTVMDQGMPMFSRRPTVAGVQAAVDQASQAIRGATLQGTWQKVVNAWTDKKPLALQLLNRRQIVEIYGDLLPQLRAYSNETQQYDADKNESAAVADELVNRWRKLSDADALADVMHDGTLAQFDPDVDQAADPEQEALRARFDGLTAGAKEIYREVRSAYINHWNKVKEAIRARIERADMSENDRRVMMEQFRDQFLQPIQGVYFPLARFGDYVITAKDAEGQRVVVFAETLSEAQAEHARMVGEFTDVSKVTLRKEYNAARDAVSKDFVRKLFETVDETATDGSEADLLKDAINQLYLTSLPDVSWAKHGIHRRGVPGYNKDARRAFAMNMFHGGYHLSKLRHVDVLQDHLRAMQEHIDSKRDVADYDSITAQQVLNEMVKRHERVMNPDSNKIANTATALGFVWFLGLSPASAIVNLSQTALVAYPIMGARFGFGKAAAALTQASKETAQARNDLRGRYGEEENAAISRAIIEGLIDVTQAHDLASISEGRDNQLHGALSPVMRAASFMFHQAEKFNRQATFIASYRLARQAGEDAAQAYETAREMTYKGHFDYAASNRPRVMMGPVARMALLFKQYGQNMIYTLARNTVLASRGDREALRTLSGILVAHGLTAGLMGLPLSSVLMGIASIIGSSDDEPWDAEVAFRNYLADAVGPRMGEVIAKGVFRSVLPGDISSRVGLDSLLIHDIDLTLDPSRAWQRIMEAAGGPLVGASINASRGVGDLVRGDLLLGIQGMLPKAVADGIKTLRYGMEGVKDRTGIEVLDEVRIRDMIAQLSGFSPARVREAYDARRAIYGAKRALDDRREELLATFSKAVIKHDDETRLRALQEIQHFNQVNPTRAIMPQSMLRSIQNRMRRQAEAKEGVYLPRNQRDLADLGRFANTQ